MHRWGLVRSHPRAERKAVYNSERQGFKCFLPQLRVEKYQRGHKVVVNEAMFTSYFFVFITDRWYSLLGTYGVASVIMGREGPQWVPDAVIKDLQARCDANQIFIRERFKPGEKVIVHRGPMANANEIVYAIYQGLSGKDRADILIKMLGHWTKGTIMERDLAPA